MLSAEIYAHGSSELGLNAGLCVSECLAARTLAKERIVAIKVDRLRVTESSQRFSVMQLDAERGAHRCRVFKVRYAWELIPI